MTSLVFTEEQTDQWVYYESDTFWRLKEMLDAVGNATTWGEFRSMLPDGEFEKLDEWVITCGEKIYWDGSKYLYIEPDKLTSFLEQAKGDEDYSIIRHNDPFNIPPYLDAPWPDFESHIWDEFPDGFTDRFETGTTWVQSKPSFDEDDFEAMKELLTKEGYDVSNIGSV